MSALETAAEAFNRTLAQKDAEIARLKEMLLFYQERLGSEERLTAHQAAILHNLRKDQQ